MAQTTTTTTGVVARPVPAAAIGRPPSSLWKDAWQRLRRNRAAVASLVFIVLLVLVAIFADVLAPYNYAAQDVTNANKAPTWQHLMGTDELGRDELTRLMRGARISLAVALMAQALILLIGVPVGAIAGYFGDRVDTLLMRFVDVMYSFPDLLLIIIVMSALRAATSQRNAGPIISFLGQAD